MTLVPRGVATDGCRTKTICQLDIRHKIRHKSHLRVRRVLAQWLSGEKDKNIRKSECRTGCRKDIEDRPQWEQRVVNVMALNHALAGSLSALVKDWLKPLECCSKCAPSPRAPLEVALSRDSVRAVGASAFGLMTGRLRSTSGLKALASKSSKS